MRRVTISTMARKLKTFYIIPSSSIYYKRKIWIEKIRCGLGKIYHKSHHHLVRLRDAFLSSMNTPAKIPATHRCRTLCTEQNVISNWIFPRKENCSFFFRCCHSSTPYYCLSSGFWHSEELCPQCNSVFCLVWDVRRITIQYIQWQITQKFVLSWNRDNKCRCFM